MSNGQDTVKTELSSLEIILRATGVDSADAGDFTAYRDSLTTAKEEKSIDQAGVDWGTDVGDDESVKRYRAILDKTIEARAKRENVTERFTEKTKDTDRIKELSDMLHVKQGRWNEAESLYADQSKLFSPTTWGKLGQTFTNLYPEKHPLHKEGQMFQAMEAMRNERLDLQNEWFEPKGGHSSSVYVGRGPSTTKSTVLNRDLSAVEDVEASLTTLEDEWGIYYGGKVPKPADEDKPEWLIKAEEATALTLAKTPKPLSKEFSSRAHIIENEDGTFTPTFQSTKLDTVDTWDDAKKMLDPMIDETIDETKMDQAVQDFSDEEPFREGSLDRNYAPGDTLPDSALAVPPGQYPPERILEHKEGQEEYNRNWDANARSIAAEESKKDSVDIHQKKVDNALLSLSQEQGAGVLKMTEKEKLALDSTSTAWVNSLWGEWEEDSLSRAESPLDFPTKAYQGPTREAISDTSLPKGIVDTGDTNASGHRIRLMDSMIEPYNKAKKTLLDQGITLQLGDSYRHLSVQQEQYDASKGTKKEGKVAKPENSLHPKGIAFDLAQTDAMKNPAVHKALIAAGFERSRNDEWFHYSMKDTTARDKGYITQKQFEMFSAFKDSAAKVASSGK